MNIAPIFEFLEKVGPALAKLSEMISPFVSFLADVALKFPALVIYIKEGVEGIFDLKDQMLADDANPADIDAMIAEENKALEEGALAEFHGSGPQFTRQIVKGTIEAWVAVIKGHRYGLEDVLAKEDKCRALGYLVSPDLDRAYEAYPQLFGKRK